MFSAPGELRPAWRRFIEATEGLPRAEFGRRWEQAQRLLQQNSLAYPDPKAPRAEPSVGTRCLSAGDRGGGMARRGGGARQRATLLDMVLQDVYGPQRLIKAGHLPAEAIFRHPGFLLPTAAQAAPPQRMLHVYGPTSPARLTDAGGCSTTAANRRQGAGFALQNRIAMSRMLPDVIHECRVERLAPYFISVQEHLARLAPDRERARVVWLSQLAGKRQLLRRCVSRALPGLHAGRGGRPGGAAEQALPENAGRPVAGRRAVAPAEQRELRSAGTFRRFVDGSRGAAAMLCAAITPPWRNGLGSGLLESPLFMAFLPQLSETLLGEPLLMPNVATWWCGRSERVERYVLSRVSELAHPTGLPPSRRQ